MKLNEWRLFKESLAGGVLGLSQPSVVGGLIGAQFNEDGDEKDDSFDADADDDDDDDSDDDFGSSDDDSDDDDHKHSADDKGGEGEDDGDGGLKGDLFGSSKDSGTEKSFPPDDSEDMDGLPTPDDAMGGDADKGKGGPGGDDDMAFLGDIDPQLLGDKDGGDAAPGGADAGADSGDPCPDCNGDGSHDLGDVDCDTCGGVGFLDDAGSHGGHDHHGHHGHHDDDAQDLGDLGDDSLGDDSMGDDLGGLDDGSDIDPQHHHDTVDLMKKMADYMGKYMHKESVTPTVPAAKSSSVKSSGGPKMMKKFMHKDHEKKNCSLENNDFMASLADQAQGTYNKKYASGLYEEPNAGKVGFAPAGRVGSIGQGYTMDDMKDIPVLGESTRYPTLTEWQQFKRRKKSR